MKTETEFPETLKETIEYFSDENRALEFVRSIRWENGVATCPRCASKESYFLPSRRMWKCKGCSHKYGARFGTIFQDSPLSLGTWMTAFWLLVNAKNGISSYEIARALGVTQKTGWFMLGRIRLAIQNGSIVKMSGTVEADETYIGGAARFMHAKVRKQKFGGKTGPVGKTVVMGLLEKHSGKTSRVRAEVLPSLTTAALDSRVRKYVLKGAEVHTDENQAYRQLKGDYVHKFVSHAETYVKDGVHTNGLENFWCLLKRCIKGTYVSVEPFHLFRYLDEQTFRFNERKDDDQGRFLKAINGIIGKRLTYKKLIGDDAGLRFVA